MSDDRERPVGQTVSSFVLWFLTTWTALAALAIAIHLFVGAWMRNEEKARPASTEAEALFGDDQDTPAEEPATEDGPLFGDD